jgi:hypothetical protein
MAGIELDGVNQKVVLDSDGDTYLEAATDDTIKVYVAGAHDATISANAINVLSGTTLTIDSGATIANSGTATGFGSNVPSSADGQALGSASAEWSDLFLADGGIIKFGNDQDVLLTHVADTGLLLSGTNVIQFNDASQNIGAPSATVLDINATDEIELNATLLDVNANLDVSGTTLLPTLGVVAAKDLGVGIHIKTGDSGGSADAYANELVIEDNDHAGIQILSGTTGTGNLDFGDSGSTVSGQIYYDHNADIMYMKSSGAHSLNLDASQNANFAGNIGIEDDKGIILGSGDDHFIGDNGGETEVAINTGTAADNSQGIRFIGMASNSTAIVQTRAGEAKGPWVILQQDQADDNADTWGIGQNAGDNGANTNLHWASYTSGSWVNKMRLATDGVLDVVGAVNASATLDYAEYFEWKTELANDAKITETYGMTVVLDGDKVRLAETGEEAKVLGVVRPTGTSAMVGGSESLAWKHQYEKNVWGEPVYEEYTLVTWNETKTKLWKDGDTLPEGKSVGDVRKTYVHKHSYHKDRIPAKVLVEDVQLDKSEYNWHTLASNLTSDNLVVPSTDAEKSAANYVERTTYKKDKGEHKKDDKLMRRKINSSYDSTKTYVGREQRRKEWCIVGLLGQVEVRDSAIVPTSWTKMKNLETGIDLYYIK